MASSSSSSDNSTDYDAGENKTPRYVKVIERPDGATSVVYGNSKDENGKIIDDHGHGIMKDGELKYSRSIGKDGSNPDGSRLDKD